MAFGKPMEMMGKKPKSAKAPDEDKGKPKPAEHGKTEGEEDGGGEHEPIHAHLKKMHEMTGNAHSHVEHHFDGHHTSHHISEHGEVSGPHEHGSTDELKGRMDQMLGGEQQPADGGGMPMEPQQHSMSGF